MSKLPVAVRSKSSTLSLRIRIVKSRASINSRLALKFAATGCALIAGWLALPAHGQIAVKNQGYVPFSEQPINYRSENLRDPVALLQKKIDRGEVKLEYEPKHGYLRSVLAK